ncbi:hypothetical protein BUALT_Bualt16G0080100 [Buddleja alternifolia]|uniref:Uncharacterized protein n=1 Tax=Buddleja alternifolia TaxID=168488 RepID=A0AAV6WJ62_9LAMI|nr:hypothetical protein BUALT_Bualt16G0080100 [Buddleja alternifolia]
MAGMLPGVEAARRRRCNLNTNIDGSSIRRPSLCLYASNHDFQITSTSSMQRNPINQTCYEDEKLEAVAREAKKRLDHKLKIYSNSEIKRKGTKLFNFMNRKY